MSNLQYTDGDNSGVTLSTPKWFFFYIFYVPYGSAKISNTNRTQVFQFRLVHRATFVAPIYVYFLQHSSQGPP